ncbi:MAG TPA: LysR family transcriptional regulator, partial [Lachnoclostridium sp.]|nr:LysR family transcriptional regulator [Lachnoclostridium sp.]
RVEEDMDIILFKRTPEGLRPTQEGELYLQAAGEILSMYDELKEK